MVASMLRCATARAALLAFIPLVLVAAACDAPVPAPCATDQLQVTMVPLGGATSQRYDAVLFTNTAALACTLQGFPALAPVDAAGAPVGAPAEPDPLWTDPNAVVTLEPGGSAHALVTSVSPGAFPAEDCGAIVVAAAADVTPPGSAAAVRVPFALERCATGVARLTVAAVAGGDPVLGG
jgi:hypothetical protein